MQTPFCSISSILALLICKLTACGRTTAEQSRLGGGAKGAIQDVEEAVFAITCQWCKEGGAWSKLTIISKEMKPSKCWSHNTSFHFTENTNIGTAKKKKNHCINAPILTPSFVTLFRKHYFKDPPLISCDFVCLEKSHTVLRLRSSVLGKNASRNISKCFFTALASGRSSGFSLSIDLIILSCHKKDNCDICSVK